MPFLPQTDLTALNTLALPARAERLFRLEQAAELSAALAAGQLAGPRFVLGGGSNLVLTGEVPGVVIQVALKGTPRVTEDGEAWYVTAPGGETWHDFVMWTLAQGYAGLENLCLIPGTVGAAPIQNIGAYGLEVGETIHRVDGVDLAQGKAWTWTQADCRFAYRDSRFKQEGWHQQGSVLITAVTFRLPKRWQPRLGYADLAGRLADPAGTPPSPQRVAAEIMALRRSKLPDPAITPNAGSFFHNPQVPAAQAARLKAQHPTLPCYPQADGRVKLAAGWLIEAAGWKGRALGPVAMYEKQALVLVNRGGAQGADVVALCQAVEADVWARFGVTLTPEPVFLPHLAAHPATPSDPTPGASRP